MSVATHVIDLSYAQNPATIQWSRVAKANIHGVIIRTGYNMDPDKQAAAHAAGAKSANLELGTYHYPIPNADLKDAEAQARMMVDRWKEIGATLAPAADLEATPKESKIVSDIQNGDANAAVKLADWIDAFLAKADSLLPDGRKALIYTGAWFNMVPCERSKAHGHRALWVASYTRPHPFIPWPWDETALWQHSANTIWRMPNGEQKWGPNKPDPSAVMIATPGLVDGVPGEVDCNALSHAMLDPLRSGAQHPSPLDLSDVRNRQRALRRLGFDPGGLDGQWGNRSTRALIRAQESLGLKTDGTWGPDTEAAIKKALA
jgi:GH25 family lysozyme M1 (1,4-beta-N-acetylmuramidase)